MSKKEDAAYTEWLAEVKAKSPDVAASLDEIAGTDAGRELFRGGLREADYYRRLNELSEAKRELETEGAKQVSWWNEAKPAYDSAVAERDELKRRLDVSNGAPPAPAPAAPSKDLEDLKSRVVAMDQGYTQVMLGMFDAQQSALREGLPFEANKVLQEVYQHKVDPLTAFNRLSAPQREEKAKTMLKNELDKAREEGYKQALSKLSGPDKVLRQGSPSLVDALRGQGDQALTDPAARRDAAVRDWLEMEAGGQL